MTKIFLIHGAFGNPEENWFPWLKKELEKQNHKIIAPTFPTPNNQTLENWTKIFKKYESEITEDTIFIGHSLAPAFLLSELENLNIKIKAAFFISGFLKLLDNETFDSINKTFVEKTFKWDLIKQNCNKFFIYHSNNDPYVPLSCAKELGIKLDTEITIIKNAGHFNESAGYLKFEELLKDIKSII